MHLPLHRLAAAFRGVCHLFVDRLPPLDVLLFLKQDVLEETHGGRVAHLVGGLQMVPIVDGKVWLQDAVEAHEAEQLIVQLGVPGWPHHAEAAARLLSRRDEKAKAAAPELLGLLRKPAKRQTVSTYFNNNRISYQSGPVNNRWYAVALTAVAPGTEDALEGHGYLALHGNPLEMDQAIDALRRDAHKAGRAVTHLVNVLGGDAPRKFSASERAEVITTLGIVGPRAAAAASVLKKIAAGSDKRLAALARAALRSVEPKKD